MGMPRGWPVGQGGFLKDEAVRLRVWADAKNRTMFLTKKPKPPSNRSKNNKLAKGKETEKTS